MNRCLRHTGGFVIPCSNIDNVLVLDDSFLANNLLSSSSRTRLVNHRPNVSAASFNRINGGGMMLDDHILLFDHSSVGSNMGHHFPFELSRTTHQNTTRQHHETTTTWSSEAESMCCICLTELSNGSSVVQMPQHCCSHVFHKDCIRKWISVRSTCPLCRRNVY